MGSFQGHALPGSIAALLGLWWTTQAPRRLLLCQQSKIPFFSTMTFPIPTGRLSRWPIEGAIKVIVLSIGVAGELFAATGFGKADWFIYMGDLQHATMYSAFLISGILDVLTYRGVSRSLPYGMDYMATSLAFVVEGLLFSFHLHGRSEIDVLIHRLLVYVIGACAIVVPLEAKYNRCLTLTLCRAYLVFLQGVWFLAAGFMLYPPLPGMKHWLDGDTDDLHLIVMVFAWHCAGAFIFLLGLYMFCHFSYRRHCRRLDRDVEYQLGVDPALKDLRVRARLPTPCTFPTRTLPSATDDEDSDSDASRVSLVPGGEIKEDQSDQSDQSL